MNKVVAGIAMATIAIGTFIGGSVRPSDAAVCRWSLAGRIAQKLAMPEAPYRHFAVIYSNVDGSYPGILMDDDMSADCVRSDWDHRPDTHIIGIVEVQLVHLYEVDTYNPPLTHWPIRFQATDNNQALCVISHFPRPMWSLIRLDAMPGSNVVWSSATSRWVDCQP